MKHRNAINQDTAIISILQRYSFAVCWLRQQNKHGDGMGSSCVWMHIWCTPCSHFGCFEKCNSRYLNNCAPYIHWQLQLDGILICKGSTALKKRNKTLNERPELGILLCCWWKSQPSDVASIVQHSYCLVQQSAREKSELRKLQHPYPNTVSAHHTYIDSCGCTAFWFVNSPERGRKKANRIKRKVFLDGNLNRFKVLHFALDFSIVRKLISLVYSGW